MTKNTALLPCPKCKGAAFIEQIGNEFHKKRGFDVGCKPCRIRIKTRVLKYDMEWCRRAAIKDWNTRPTAPQNAALGVDRQSVDQETVTNEMIAAALEESLAVMKEYGVDGLSPFSDYPPPSEVVKRAITAALKVRPTAPQNAEAWERANELIDRIDVQCRAVGRPVGGLEEIKFILRAALQSPPPRTPKIDGLREAVEKLKREPPPWTGHALTSQETSILNEQARYANIANEVIDSVLKIIDRAQLAAQEGGCLAESAKPETLHKPASDKQALHKIDGLREAVAAYETEYWKARKAPRDQWAPFDFILEAARAQLAAQEGGVG